MFRLDLINRKKSEFQVAIIKVRFSSITNTITTLNLLIFKKNELISKGKKVILAFKLCA